MRALPLNIGTVHFVGIGGIGMSGIAEILHNLGYSVQGSDLDAGANVKRLRDLGVEVAIGHAEENLGDAQVIVISSAVKPDNVEVEAGATAPAAGGAPGRNAGRVDAPQMVDRRRRHPRQDDHHVLGCRRSRCRRPRPDGDQRRHRQCLGQ